MEYHNEKTLWETLPSTNSISTKIEMNSETIKESEECNKNKCWLAERGVGEVRCGYKNSFIFDLYELIGFFKYTKYNKKQVQWFSLIGNYSHAKLLAQQKIY